MHSRLSRNFVLPHLSVESFVEILFIVFVLFAERSGLVGAYEVRTRANTRGNGQQRSLVARHERLVIAHGAFVLQADLLHRVRTKQGKPEALPRATHAAEICTEHSTF